MNQPQQADGSEPEELSFASFAAQAADGALLTDVSNLLTKIVTERTFNMQDLEPIMVQVFAGLRSEIHSQIAWNFPVKVKDYRPLHALNTCRLAMHFGMASGMDDARVVQLGIVGLMTDVSMWMPNLPGMNEARELSAEELAAYEQAVVAGAQLLQGIDGIDPLCAYVAAQHHERADGTGYPQRTKADQHHPYSRLLQIIDSFLGMIEPRVFRKAISPVEAMQRLAVQAHRGYFHEPSFRDWLKVMGVFPVGTFVTLNTGELAIVSRSGGDSLRRPQVQVLADELLEFRLKPMKVDLAAEPAFDIASAFTKFPKS